MLSLLAGVAALVGGYQATKRFVLKRLRYVDEMKDPAAPWLAGAAGTVVGLPFAILPVVTVATAVALGVGVGWGVAAAGRKLDTEVPPA
ncbi:MAG: hypothetical protein HY704_11445 [Gemmatimonadetes bacterium]|nr:hypothetical protein [Gemmatimonadota bacterium]